MRLIRRSTLIFVLWSNFSAILINTLWWNYRANVVTKNENPQWSYFETYRITLWTIGNTKMNLNMLKVGSIGSNWIEDDGCWQNLNYNQEILFLRKNIKFYFGKVCCYSWVFFFCFDNAKLSISNSPKYEKCNIPIIIFVFKNFP